VEVDNLDSFTAIISSSEEVTKYDFVYYINNFKKVMGYIENIRSYTILPSEVPWEIVSKMPLDEKTSVVLAKIRTLEEGLPKIGDWIYRASDEDVENLFKVPPHRAIHIGTLVSRPQVRITLDLNALSRHLAIIAATGSGKTWTTVVLIEEILKKGGTILILDPHGEYSKIKEGVKELGADTIVLRARNDQEGDVTYSIDLSSVDADELAFVMGLPKQATRLRAVLVSLRSLIEEIALKTGKREWYSLSKMKEVLLRMAEAAETADSYVQFETILRSNNIPTSSVVKRLWNVLRKNADPAYDLMKYIEEIDRLGVYATRPTPLGIFLRPATATVFNLSGVKSEVQMHLVYNILKRTFNARVRYLRGLKGEKYPYPVQVILEEAHRFARPPSEGQSWTTNVVKRIASEGRKFGVFLIVVTQRPSRIDPTVLSQCQSQIIMRIVNPKDQQAVVDSSEELGARLASDLPALRPGEAIIVGPIINKPALVKVREKTLEYGGGDIDLTIEWSKAKIAKEELEKLDKTIRAIPESKLSEKIGIPLSKDLIERAKAILISEEIYLTYDNVLKVHFENCEVVLNKDSIVEDTCMDPSYTIAALIEAFKRNLVMF